MSTTTTATPATRPTRRVKVGHLVAGVLLLGLAVLWLLGTQGLLAAVSLTYLLPLLLIGAGVLGLVAMLVGGMRSRRTTADQSQPEPRIEHDDDPDDRGLLTSEAAATDPDRPHDTDLTAPITHEEKR